MSVPRPPAVPRLAFRVGEAAQALGVSPDYFAQHVAPELRWVRRGALKLVSREEIEAWLQRSAARTLDEEER
jgi:excisionase family DNA binding protein